MVHGFSPIIYGSSVTAEEACRQKSERIYAQVAAETPRVGPPEKVIKPGWSVHRHEVEGLKQVDVRFLKSIEEQLDFDRPLKPQHPAYDSVQGSVMKPDYLANEGKGLKADWAAAVERLDKTLAANAKKLAAYEAAMASPTSDEAIKVISNYDPGAAERTVNALTAAVEQSQKRLDQGYEAFVQARFAEVTEHMQTLRAELLQNITAKIASDLDELCELTRSIRHLGRQVVPKKFG